MDERPSRLFRDQRLMRSRWVDARIALASVVMGRKNWSALYRSILEMAEHDPLAVTRFLDGVARTQREGGVRSQATEPRHIGGQLQGGDR